MKPIVHFVLTWTLFFLLSHSSFAQSTGQTQSISFIKARAMLRTGERLETDNGILFPTYLMASIGGRKLTIQRENIRILEIARSNSATKGLIAGAGIGAGSFLVVLAASVALAESSDDWELYEPAALVGIATMLTISGAVGGYAIGSKTPQWETVSMNQPGAALYKFSPRDRYGLTVTVRLSF